MGEARKQDVNFVVVPTMTEHDVISLLLNRFPAMRDLLCADEESRDLATCVYDRFAAEVVRGAGDREFFASVIRFIDDIAEGRDTLLRTVLEMDLLEGIAADADVAQKVSDAVGDTARRLLHDVERKTYGRIR